MVLHVRPECAVMKIKLPLMELYFKIKQSKKIRPKITRISVAPPPPPVYFMLLGAGGFCLLIATDADNCRDRDVSPASH
jgi:hypothetical protein